MVVKLCVRKDFQAACTRISDSCWEDLAKIEGHFTAIVGEAFYLQETPDEMLSLWTCQVSKEVAGLS